MKAKKVDPEKDAGSIDPSNVTTKFLAEVLGLAASVVSRLYQTRVIIQNGRRGRYDLRDAIPKYLQSIRSSGTAEAGARLKITQREKLEIQNAKERGELVRVDDAAEVFRQACISWRAGASAIPRRMANGLTPAARKALTDELASLFTEVEKPFSEYFGAAWNSPAPTKPRTGRPGPAAKKIPRRMGGRKSNPTARKRGTRKVAKR